MEAAPIPPPSDTLFLADLYRALVARAARLNTPEAAATVDRDGDAICRLFTVLDTVAPQTGAVITLSLGYGGGCRVVLVTQEPD